MVDKVGALVAICEGLGLSFELSEISSKLGRDPDSLYADISKKASLTLRKDLIACFIFGQQELHLEVSHGDYSIAGKISQALKLLEGLIADGTKLHKYWQVTSDAAAKLGASSSLSPEESMNLVSNVMEAYKNLGLLGGGDLVSLDDGL